MMDYTIPSSLYIVKLNVWLPEEDVYIFMFRQ